jgi:hypothetical protein
MSLSSFPSHATVADAFVQMLPGLRRRLWSAFAGFQREQREDALQETLASSFLAFARLWERDRSHLAAPRALAGYAIKRWFDGRRVGCSMNCKDVTSPYARRLHSLRVVNLGDCEAVVREIAFADLRSPVPSIVALRVDFPEWLRQLTPRNREVALALARGQSTREVAQTSGLSCARVSQLRRELHNSWREFHGEGVPRARAA